MDPMQQFLDGLNREELANGMVTRREFLRRVALIGGGTAVALSFAGVLSCAPSATPTPLPTSTPVPTPTLSPTSTPGPGETVAPHDPRIDAGPVEFQGKGPR